MKKQDAYLKALNDCAKVGQEEFKAAIKFSKKRDSIVGNLSREFSEIVKKAKKVTAKGQVADKGLDDIQKNFGSEYELLRAKQVNALERQRESLKSFSIMLFGRTMAGKSTIREAITGGDGTTIGKGAQRTTRDIRQYQWNHLRIIDTPGFGAFNGDEDAEMARSILEQSDVVLFLISDDSIQESTLAELEHAYRLNKPLIFVINVKKDLEKNIYRKKSINNPDNYLYDEAKLYGHRERLRQEAAKMGMNPRSINIIPIHAQAAFLSTQQNYIEEKDDLYRISRIGDLQELITAEAMHKGRARRIQTLLGSSLNHTSNLEELIRSQTKSVQSLLNEYASTTKSVEHWHKRQLKRTPDKIDRDISYIYGPLIKSISSFVDDNIQSSSFGARLERHIKSFDLDERYKKVSANIAKEIAEDLNRFNRDMVKDIELQNKLKIRGGSSSYDPFDYKRMNGWLSASAGVLSAIAFANSWNPVGWGLVAAGFVFGLFSMFSDSKARRLQAAKRDRTNEIRNEISAYREKAIKELNNWFSKDIEKKQILPVKKDLAEVCVGLEKFTQSLERAFIQLDRLEHDVNERYLLRTMDAVADNKYQKPQIKRIVRQPGYACYFTVSNYFKEPSLIKKLQDILGEKIIVVYENTIEQMLTHIFKLNRNDARIEKEGSKYYIYAKEEDLGRIIGKDGRNIMLAAAICDINLEAKQL